MVGAGGRGAERGGGGDGIASFSRCGYNRFLDKLIMFRIFIHLEFNCLYSIYFSTY